MDMPPIKNFITLPERFMAIPANLEGVALLGDPTLALFLVALQTPINATNKRHTQKSLGINVQESSRRKAVRVIL